MLLESKVVHLSVHVATLLVSHNLICHRIEENRCHVNFDRVFLRFFAFKRYNL